MRIWELFFGISYVLCSYCNVYRVLSFFVLSYLYILIILPVTNYDHSAYAISCTCCYCSKVAGTLKYLDTLISTNILTCRLTAVDLLGFVINCTQLSSLQDVSPVARTLRPKDVSPTKKSQTTTKTTGTGKTKEKTSWGRNVQARGKTSKGRNVPNSFYSPSLFTC